MPKNKKSLTRKKLSLRKLNLPTLLLTLKTFQSSQLLMPQLLRKTWMLKRQRRNLKPHLKLISNLLSIKDILRNKPLSLPIKRHLPINKLVNKLRKRLSPMILFHQRRESQLQQSQQQRRLLQLNQRPKSQSKKLAHQQRIPLLQRQCLMSKRKPLKDQSKIKFSKHKNNRKKLKQLLTKRNKQLPLLRSPLQLQRLLSQLPMIKLKSNKHSKWLRLNLLA